MSIKWGIQSVVAALDWWRARHKLPERPTITVRETSVHHTQRRHESTLTIVPLGVAPRPLEHPLAYAARAQQTKKHEAIQLAQLQLLDAQLDVVRHLFHQRGTPHLLERRLCKYASELAAHDGADREPSLMARRMVRELDPINLVVNQLGDA